MIPSAWQWRVHIPSPHVELEDASGRPEDYDDRNGYLADFLGDRSDFLVPLPLLRDKSDLLQVEQAPKERPFELRYQNFSVIMSRSRRFCCLTGVNFDGRAPFFRFKRPGWKTDPRIPKAAQIDGAEFYVPTVFDRGHMTNSCPQVHSFNDATWGDLEDWILSQERSRASKGSVFTGPIFHESDPMYQGVRVPVAFYKVVAVIDDAKDQLSVTAFEMDQSDVMPLQPGTPMPEAPFDPGRFSVDQITLSELEERSGLDFGRLKEFDVLAAQAVPRSVLEGARLRLPLLGSVRSCFGSLTLRSGSRNTDSQTLVYTGRPFWKPRLPRR
jgi:endonuclease G, mitochondrial